MKKFLLTSALLVALIAPASAAEGPSFNCMRATTPDEVAICQNDALARKDPQMATLYFQLLNTSGDDVRNFLRRAQATWLTNRHRCGYDAVCIGDAYDNRIVELMPPPPVYVQPSLPNYVPPPVPFPEAPACFAVSDDGFVNVREWPNGPLIGPVPVGTPFNVLSTWFDDASNLQWSRIQTPWLARVGRTGVVATYLIQCN